MSDESTAEVLTDMHATDAAPMADQSSIPAAEPDEPPQKRSAADSVKAAMDKVLAPDSDDDDDGEEKTAKPAGDKPKKEAAKAKPEAEGEDEGGDEPTETADKPADKARQRREDADKPANIPARLLPKARDVWMNTPRVVQAEFERMEREHAAEIEQHREAREFADDVGEYRQMAQQAGTTVKAALDRYVAFDRQIAQDFGNGIAALAHEQGKSPGEAISSLMRAYGITPQQYAQHIAQNPQAQYAASPSAQQQQQQRPDPSGQQALQELQEIKRAMQIQQIETQIIAPIMPQMPRYAELQNDIAFFLQSGKVPDSLSPADRVLTAYDMAERLNPSPVSADRASDDPDPAPASTAGRKSISGSPSNGVKYSGKPKVMSIKESIDDAMRRM